MTEAIFYVNKSSVVYGFKICGHSGFAKRGSDIVCSAISVLVINTINSLKTLANQKTVVEMDDTIGLISCILPEIKRENTDADILIKSLILGLKSLEDDYGKFIKVKEEHTDD